MNIMKIGDYFLKHDIGLIYTIVSEISIYARNGIN